MVEMRVVFLGTPEFAIPSLRALLDNCDVCAVFTQPDRPAGRGQRPRTSPVKRCAEERGIPVYQPEKIRAEENRAIFEKYAPDFIVVVAFGQILPGWLLRSPRIAPVNVHASLLPKYRGAAPVAWALLNGDTVSGVTTMIMDEHLDTGPMLLRREVPVPETMNAGELAARLSAVGAEILVPTLEGLRSGTLQPVPQDDSMATVAPGIKKEMAEINWLASAREIHNRIRAFNPWPLAFTAARGRRVQILRSLPGSAVIGETTPPGTYLEASRDGINVSCGHGSVLEVLELKLEGKSVTSGREFASGARLRPGEHLFGSS